jgi:hypothetical protein
VSAIICARVSTSGQLLPFSEDAFWLDVNRYSLVAITLAHKLQKGVPEVHVNDMIHTLSNLEHLRDLINAIAPSVSREVASEIEWLKAYLKVWHDEDHDAWYSERYQNLHQGAVAKFASQLPQNRKAR